MLVVQGCRISGTDSGECRTYDENYPFMPFCSKYVKYTACVPQFDPVWPNHTLTQKDAWVQRQATAIIQERKRHERNETLKDEGVNELGEEGEVTQRFWNGDEEDPDGIEHAAGREGTPRTDCELSYERFMCYVNFPRCDEEEKSLILCRSVCENYFRSCKYDQDLWRCGPTKWLNGYEPEKPEIDEDTGDESITWRGLFTGQPFRDYEEDTSDPENPVAIPICTPGIKDAATRISLSIGIIAFAATLLLSTLV